MIEELCSIKIVVGPEFAFTKVYYLDIKLLERGEIPGLDALRLHNGTVYKWNRPCYGISEALWSIK